MKFNSKYTGFLKKGDLEKNKGESSRSQTIIQIRFYLLEQVFTSVGEEVQEGSLSLYISDIYISIFSFFFFGNFLYNNNRETKYI